MMVMKWMFWIVPMLELVARAHGQQTVQIQVQPQVVGHSIRDGQVTTVFLAPRYVTAIRMPEADQLGGGGRPGVVLRGAFGARTQLGVRKTNYDKGGGDQSAHIVGSRPAGKPAPDQPRRTEGAGTTRSRFPDAV